METIILKPKTRKESDQVLRVLEQMKIDSEIHRDRTKDEILNSIEHGAKEARDYLDGKIKLRTINDLLNELSCYAKFGI